MASGLCRARAGAGRSAISAAGPGPRAGLDCVGLVLRPSDLRPNAVRRNYRLRGDHRGRNRARGWPELLSACAKNAAEPGDVMFLAVAAEQLHSESATDHGFVHADARNRPGRRNAWPARVAGARHLSQTAEWAEPWRRSCSAPSGTVLGGPVGGAIGSLIGQSIDQQLSLGPRRGPRLGDLSVQTSSYGTQIPRIYGTMRVAGTVIWATDLIESSQTTRRQGPAGYDVQLFGIVRGRTVVATAARVGASWADGSCFAARTAISR